MIYNNELHADENSNGDSRAPCEQAAPEIASNGVTAIDPPYRRRSHKARGAGTGNRRAATHGLRMVNGRLPQGASWIRREADDMKRRLETAVIEAKGELSILDVATINEVVTWEKHRLLASRWLRLSHDELNHDQRLNFSREVAKSATERNKALRLLGIDAQSLNPWSTLDAAPLSALEPSEAPTAEMSRADAPNAAGANPGALNGTPGESEKEP